MAVSAAEYMEIRWRVKGADEAWSAPRRVASGLREVVVEELERDVQYEFEARNVSNCGAQSAWVPSDYTVPGLPAGTITLAGLQSEAAAAQESANAALEQLDAIDDDGVLTPAEKPTVIRDVAVIQNEYPGLLQQGQAYQLATELDQYQQAYTDLMDYLATLNTPFAWNDLTGNTYLP